jgi:hypothetical protein
MLFLQCESRSKRTRHSILCLCWLLSHSTHKKRRLSMMNPSIVGQMATVASTGHLSSTADSKQRCTARGTEAAAQIRAGRLSSPQIVGYPFLVEACPALMLKPRLVVSGSFSTRSINPEICSHRLSAISGCRSLRQKQQDLQDQLDDLDPRNHLPEVPRSFSERNTDLTIYRFREHNAETYLKCG